MQRMILSCFSKENILSRHRKIKQNRDCPAPKRNSYDRSRRKKKDILRKQGKFGSQHEHFLLQTYGKSMQLQLKYLQKESSDTFLHFCMKVTASAGIKILGEHTISLSSSSFSSSKKRIALTLFTARSFQVSSDISFTKLSSAPHRGRLSVRTAKCN